MSYTAWWQAMTYWLAQIEEMRLAYKPTPGVALPTLNVGDVIQYYEHPKAFWKASKLRERKATAEDVDRHYTALVKRHYVCPDI